MHSSHSAQIQTRSETVVSYPELSVARGYIYLYQLQRFMSYDERYAHKLARTHSRHSPCDAPTTLGLT